jgi:dipeptidyl aminopeptidase/acylaminoacyl peptidase
MRRRNRTGFETVPNFVRRRGWIWGTGAILASYLVLCWLLGVWVAEGTLHPGRRPLLPTDLEHAREIALAKGAELSEVTISAADGATLRAWILQSHNSNRQAVIVLHGLGDNRMGMIGYAEMLLSHGFSVLMPDARAHGVSGGGLATFGLLESADILAWVDWLYANTHGSCVFGVGESMGAAQLLQAAGSTSHFCAVVAESPFSNFREIAYDRMGQFFHTGPWLGRTILRPVVEIAFWHVRYKYSMDVEQVSPDRAVALSRIPVLLVHGQVDGNIPIRHSRQIVADNPQVKLWEVAGADHCGAIAVARAQFEQRVVGWFAEHDRQVSGAAKVAEGESKKLLARPVAN